MATTKAGQKAVNKYVRENYDKILVTVPKGAKETIKASAAAAGVSVNQYIKDAIAHRTAPQVSGCTLSPDVVQAAQRAAQAAGETVPEFIARAVRAQADRDNITSKLKRPQG